jgi:hypothetical protein
MTTAPLKPPKLTQFQVNVLELVATSNTLDHAIGYIRDWLRCNRAEAIRHINEAQQDARRIEEIKS